MERLCIICASLAGKQLDIEEGQWKLGTCSGCERPEQLLWPVIGQSVFNWSRQRERDKNTTAMVCE